jgi:hypothetical protein
MNCGPRGCSPATLASTVPPKSTRAWRTRKWPSREWPRQIGLAQAQGEGAQILAIERQDVEAIRLDFAIVLARAQDIEIGNTANPKDDSFAINELICSTPRTTRREFCKRLRSDRK